MELANWSEKLPTGFYNIIDISVDAARKHESWFVKFQELKAKQKEAIIKWKNEKKILYVPECNPKITGNMPNKRTNEKVVSKYIKSKYC